VSKPAGRQHPGGLVITAQSLPAREGEAETQTSLSPKTMAIVADKTILEAKFRAPHRDLRVIAIAN